MTWVAGLDVRLSDFSTLTLDCYGTLIDWESGILAALRPWADRNGVSAGDGELLAAFAGAEPREQERDPGAAYPVILARVFCDIAPRWGVEPDRGEAERFGASIGDWPAFDDSAAALSELQNGYRLVVRSNVDRASFRLSNDRLGVEFDLVVTAQDVGSYKPAPGHFERAIELLAERGVARSEVLHTAQLTKRRAITGAYLPTMAAQ